MKLIDSKVTAVKLDVGYDLFRKVIKHDPDFPKAIKLTPKSHPKWVEEEIDNYLKKKAA